MTNKTIKYKAIKNDEIAEAVLDLAKPFIGSANGNDEIIKAFVDIAVKSWNISLFTPESGDYTKEIDSAVPKNLDMDKTELLKKFVWHMILEKQHRYPDYLKGITSYNVTISEGRVNLKLESLPVKPV